MIYWYECTNCKPPHFWEGEFLLDVCEVCGQAVTVFSDAQETDEDDDETTLWQDIERLEQDGHIQF